MKFPLLFRKTCILVLISTFLSMSMQSSVFAGIINNDQLVVDSTMQMKRDAVTTFLARDEVRSSLLGAGVSSADVDTRVNNLSDSQVQQIHNQMNALPAGGNGVLGAILVIVVIFILLDVAGATDVFPGI